MFEEWIAMEEFYYNNMWYFVILSSFMAFIFFPMLLYYKKRFAQVFFLAAIIIWIVSGVYIYQGYQKYGDLIPLTQYSNPSNRLYEKKVFNDFPYSRSQYTLYRMGYMKEYFEKIQLYQPDTIRGEVEYLGNDGSYYYFAYDEDEIYYVGDRFVEFSQEAETTERIGVKFYLKDPRFEEIGFIPDSASFFTHYQVPESLKNKQVDSSMRNKANYQASMMLRGWIVP